ncbi:MAG: hypothetical protein QG639_705, partial [Patescibacteria group bacterium]|nr:hypothetical protein [Patescibacteria group bacterium]
MVQSKIVKIIIPILFILLGLLVGISFLQNQGKEKIELRYAPSIATVTIDDKEYKNGTVYLKQGKHIFKAELEGFKTESFDFDTDTKELGVALKPSNETGYKLLRDNIEYQKEIEEIG